MEELPKLYQEEQPESQKRSKLAIAVIVLLLLAMPLGVYLSLRTQNTTSQADTETPAVNPEHSIALESRTQSINNQAIFPIDVVIRSDQQPSNLISTRLNYSPDTLEVISIASSSADLNDPTRIYPATEWLDASFNNDQGFVNLVAGIPQDGLLTNPQATEKNLLATIYFKAKQGGTETDLLLQEGSLLLQTSSGENHLSSAKSLTLMINDTIGDFTDQSFASQAEQFKQTASASASVKIDTPNGGEVFPYLSPVNVSWSQIEATGSTQRRTQSNTIKKTASIAILMNNLFLGLIATDLEDNGSYLWKPSETLPSSYIKPENSFKLELSLTNPQTNQTEKIISAGPFSLTLQNTTTAILLNQEALTQDKADVNADGVVDYKDASMLLRHYYSPVTQQNIRTDFNNDRLINALDLWYLKRVLIP